MKIIDLIKFVHERGMSLDTPLLVSVDGSKKKFVLSKFNIVQHNGQTKLDIGTREEANLRLVLNE